MSYAYMKRPAVPAIGNAAPSAVWNAGAVRSIPNSAFPGALDGGMGREKLEQAMRAKMGSMFGLRWENQAAEAEADRIGGQFSGASGVEDLKTRMGDAMGADFSGVRFHTGAEAAAMAASAHAEAFASGRDIYLGGPFDAATAAHELVHTVQQGAVQAAAPVMSAPAGAVQCKPKKKGRASGYGLIAGAQRTWNNGTAGEAVPAKSAPAKKSGGKHKKRGRVSGFSLAAGAQRDWNQSKVDSYHKAVDDYNNYEKDFKEMSGVDQAMWIAQNPAAWFFGGTKWTKGDTKRRNAERKQQEDWENDMAAKLAASRNAPAAVDTTAPNLSGGGFLSDAQDAISTVNSATGDMGTGTGISVPGLPDEIAKTGEAIDNIQAGKPKEELKGLGPGFSKAATGISMANNLSSVMGDAAEGVENVLQGNNREAKYAIANEVADGIAAVSDKAALNGRDTLSGGLSIASSALQTGIGFHRAYNYANSRDNLMSLSAKYTQNGEYQGLLSRTAAQAGRAADIRASEGKVKGVSSALRTVGGAAYMVPSAGYGQLIGAGISTAAAGVEALGNAMIDDKRQGLVKDTLNERMNLDAEAKKLRQGGYNKALGLYGNGQFSSGEARRIILKSNGIADGSAMTAFNQMTDADAVELSRQANEGNQEAAAILKEMGLSRVTGGYNARAVSKALGRGEDEPDDNPFAANAEANRKRKKHRGVHRRRRSRYKPKKPAPGRPSSSSSLAAEAGGSQPKTIEQTKPDWRGKKGYIEYLQESGREMEEQRKAAQEAARQETPAAAPMTEEEKKEADRERKAAAEAERQRRNEAMRKELQEKNAAMEEERRRRNAAMGL